MQLCIFNVHTRFICICYGSVFDGINVDINNGGIRELFSEPSAHIFQVQIKSLAGSVIGYSTTMLIKFG